jgi:hypothetical protein
MNDPVRVRTAATGLVSFAAAEEQMLLAATVRDGPRPARPGCGPAGACGEPGRLP